MTPADHLAKAEQLLATASNGYGSVVPDDQRLLIIAALAHTGIAIAAELGVPHPQAPGTET